MNEDWVMYQSGKEKGLAGAQDPTSLISDKSKVLKVDLGEIEFTG